MALVDIIAINQTVSALPLKDLYAPNAEIPASDEVNLITYNTVGAVQESAQLLTYIQGDSVLLRVGSTNLTKSQSLAFLDASTVPVKVNYGAASPPTTTDDETLGYSIGSVWITTAGAVYFAADVTTDAAVWKSASGDVVGPGSSDKYGLARFADTTGKLIEGAGVRWYPSGAVDPVPGGGVPSPTDGDLYYNTALKMPMFYDGARLKWLSVEECVIQWSRSGNTAPGSYYKIDGDLTFTSTNGFYTGHNGTIISMAYTRDDTDSATFEIRADGVLITGASLLSTAVKGASTAINANFASGVVLSVYNAASGNTVTNVAGRARLRWRV